MTESASNLSDSPISRIRGKGRVLDALRGRLANGEVLELLSVPVDDWINGRAAVLRAISHRFGPQRLAVRSDAMDEDGMAQTLAGHYHSRLNVPGWDCTALAQAVDAVVACYTDNPGNRVLVQPMALEVRLSGVATTHCMSDGAAYIVIGWDDSGRTDVVTRGAAARSTVFVHRSTTGRRLAPPELQPLLPLLAEIETHFPGQAVELEFALQRATKPLVLQVRPLPSTPYGCHDDGSPCGRTLATLAGFVETSSTPAPGLFGARTILGTMPDWNPAEMIGARPRPLAFSLYRALITRSTWRQARQMMGYRAMPGVELMCGLAGRPYIDVRNSFNSFLPVGLDPAIAEVLVGRWLDRLEREPALHDRVELDIAQTCLAFDFDAHATQHYTDVLPRSAVAEFREALRILTCRSLLGRGAGGLAAIHAIVRRLARRQRRSGVDRAEVAGDSDVPKHLPDLLGECRELGTLPFAMAARHAFIAEALLGSAHRRGALSAQRLADFRRSVRSIATRFTEDCRRLGGGLLSRHVFMVRYGHLRPGTYDIRAARYAERPDLLGAPAHGAGIPAANPFVLQADEVRAIDRLLAECGLIGVQAADLFAYARRAIALREYAKFIFTRHVSLVLESVAAWAQAWELTRDGASYLTLEDVTAQHLAAGARDRRMRLRDLLAARRAEFHEHDAIRLSPLIVRPGDVYCFTLPAQTPSFVGTACLTAPVVRLDGTASRCCVAGRIVCVESADPGYDWIFAQGAVGLVTQFGGPNSHMAVRCAEFGLPAALGCGESMFRRIAASAAAHLDCGGAMIEPASAT